jgi:FAD/FMN-containing dehydrogenase
MPTSQSPQSLSRLPRRTVLRAAAATGLAAVGWQTAFRIPAAADADVPPGVETYVQAYRNWSGEIRADAVPTCAPRSVEQVVAVVEWARSRGVRVRAVGMRHGWSPLTITDGGAGAAMADGGNAATGGTGMTGGTGATSGAGGAGGCVLVDLTRYLTGVEVSADGGGMLVTAQTGVTMDVLLARLEEHGAGLAACPAPGDLTLGGVLAIDGHGTAVPVDGAPGLPGQTFGSVSNLVTELTAVVWDPSQGAYAARTFTRADAEAAALLVHLGRALIVSATLRVAPNQRLRCVSRTDVAADRLFAPPESAGSDCFAAFVESCGRVETIWFPYTDAPWLKLWSVAPERPATARETFEPYNYPFSDEIPQAASDLLKLIIEGATWLTPLYASVAAGTVAGGLVATDSADLWGWSKNTLLYVLPSTLRVTANGYAVVTRRENVQEVVSKVYRYLSSTLAAYQDEGRFPVNGPWEVRVTGLDDPADCRVPGAREPLLSAVRPGPGGGPDAGFDTAVWLDVLTLPGTPDSLEFYAGLERFLLAEFDGTTARLRPEWSKGWAYGDAGAWTDPTFLHRVIPAAVQDGRAADDGWQAALAALAQLDPDRLYGNAFLDDLMGGWNAAAAGRGRRAAL